VDVFYYPSVSEKSPLKVVPQPMNFNRRTFLKSTAGALGTSAIVSTATHTDATAANTADTATTANNDGTATAATIDEDVIINAKGREVPVRTGQVSYSRAAGGIVSTNDAAATQAGLEILNDGGNAVDAAVAASLALCVTDTRSISLGGGGNMIFYNADKDTTSMINFHARAAGAAEPELFRGQDGEPLSFDELVNRGLVFGVPGLVKGFDVALERWGTRDFAGVTDPAIELASKGFLLDAEETGRALQKYGEYFGEAARDVFFRNGEPYQVGERLVQEDLAHSLRLLKNKGAKVFYEGEIADAIANTIQDHGGIVTREDLARYTATVHPPIWCEYNDHRIATGPTTDGYPIAQILELLDAFDLSKYGVRSVDKYERIGEAMRLAVADAGEYVADPEFVDVPREGLLSEEYIAQRRTLMNLGEAITGLQPGNPWKYQSGMSNQTSNQVSHASQSVTSAGAKGTSARSRETTFVAAADSDGNMIGINQSLGIGFQGGLVVPGYGIFLSVEPGYFSADPNSVHVIAPYKRQMWGSSTIVFQDGEPRLCLGSPGEKIAAVSSVILHMLSYDMTLAEAIVVSRVEGHTEPTITWETGVPAKAREKLQQRGFEIPEEWVDIGNVNAVWGDIVDEYVGAADSRRNGTAIGTPADPDDS
jgi:gamma-glutamyltranspeptidase/glutathione hydrolase